MKAGTTGKVFPDSQAQQLRAPSSLDPAAPAHRRTVLQPLPPVHPPTSAQNPATVPRPTHPLAHMDGASGKNQHSGEDGQGKERYDLVDGHDDGHNGAHDQEVAQIQSQAVDTGNRESGESIKPEQQSWRYQSNLQRYEEDLLRLLKDWEEETLRKYKTEKQEQTRMESDDDYVQSIAGWMREVGGVAQTVHPIWKKIQEYAKDAEVNKLKPSEVMGHEKTQSLVSDVQDHFLGEGNKLFSRTDPILMKKGQPLYRNYNCCGDIGLHMVFLNAYIFSFQKEEDKKWYPNEQLICVGKHLIENKMVHVDHPYESDLEFWKSLIGSIRDKSTASVDRNRNKSEKDLLQLQLPQHFNTFVGGGRDLSKSEVRGHIFSGLYTGETVLHMAIVFCDEDTVEWLLKHGASLERDAKATGAFFMPRVTRRGHLDEKKTWWREWKTVNNIQSDDDVVGSFNPLSAHSDRDLYFGQYPLAFAVSQGHQRVCEIIHQYVSHAHASAALSQQMPPQWEDLVNKVDDLGNTPLHIAVMHSKLETFDWLLANGATNSLKTMNKQGLTPFTLAVWLGDVEMYTYFANKVLSTLLWKYGHSDLKLTDLEQIDTFRTRSVLKNTEEYEEDLKNCHIHAHPSWRSAFEIIVEKELKAFTGERIFDHLVMSKWHSFGRTIYFFRVFMLYMIILTFFFAASMVRINTLKDVDRKPQTGWAAFTEDDSGIMWILLTSIGTILLGNISWILLRVKRKDLDKDHDGSVSTEEAMMFLFKNLGSLCGFISCILFIVVTTCRSLGWDQEEHALIACTSVIMFCNVLPIVTAFKYIGVLVLTTYRMLISDIARFILVYIVMLLGFSTAMYVLFDTSEEATPIENNLQLTDFGSVMRKMLYISLGEVGSLDREMETPLQLVIYFVWVVLTNVLLLNLLISMMGQTFSDIQGDTHNAWVFPVANFILRCESHIQSRRWRIFTRSGKRGSTVKEKTGSKNREVEDDKIVEASKYNPRYPWPWPWHMSRKTFELCHKIKKEARFTELRAGIIEEDKEANNMKETLEDIQTLLEHLSAPANQEHIKPPKTGPPEEAGTSSGENDEMKVPVVESKASQRALPLQRATSPVVRAMSPVKGQTMRSLTPQPMNNAQQT